MKKTILLFSVLLTTGLLAKAQASADCPSSYTGDPDFFYSSFEILVPQLGLKGGLSALFEDKADAIGKCISIIYTRIEFLNQERVERGDHLLTVRHIDQFKPDLLSPGSPDILRDYCRELVETGRSGPPRLIN